MTKHETRNSAADIWRFVILVSDFIRHSDFDIRHLIASPVD